MAFVAAFTVAQSSDGADILITDASNYSDEAQGTFSDRRIFLYKIDGTTLVPDGTTTTYVDWPFGVGSILTIPGVLSRDYSLTVEGDWISTSPQVGSTYIVTDVKTFLSNINEFAYGKLQQEAADPRLKNNTNWRAAISELNDHIENAERATEYDDQFCAQSEIDQAYFMIQNENKYF